MSVPHEHHITETSPLKLMLLPNMPQALPTMVTNPIPEFVQLQKLIAYPLKISPE
jgi:hypothetical protein